MCLVQVFTEAAELIKTTLDVDGTIVVDLAAFEAIETVEPDGTTSTRYQADPYAMASGVDDSGEQTPVEDRAPAFIQRQSSSLLGALAPLPVLAASGILPDQERISRQVPAEEHQKLALWLKDNPDGKVGSWSSRLKPSTRADGSVESSDLRRRRADMGSSPLP